MNKTDLQLHTRLNNLETEIIHRLNHLEETLHDLEQVLSIIAMNTLHTMQKENPDGITVYDPSILKNNKW